MSTEVEELHNIAISIMQNSTINVIIDNSLETAMTDYKNIYVTVQLIPQELRKFRRVVSRVLDGEVAHEAGHIVVTAPVKAKLMEWMSRQPNPRMANIVHQALEDKRVNHYILQRYRFDFAFRLQLLADVANRLWLDSLRAKIAEQRTGSNLMKPDSYLLEGMIISVATLKGLWDEVDIEKEFQLNEDQKEFIRKTKKIFDDARFDRMIMSVVGRHQQLYNLWSERISRTGERPEENIPKGQGGDMKILKSGASTKKMLANMEKSLKKAEEKAEEEAKKENLEKKDAKDGMAAGSGTGLNIPTPVPDEPEYIRIAQRNREHIEKLLNLLKVLATPKIVNDKWRPQGRFMTEVLTQAYVSSNRRKIRDIYAHRSLKMERAEACIGLLVDLSGSVNIQDAMDSLTVISEVCGRWLRDEDFAIMVFGSEFQKIKAFVEPYHTTRQRIGGLTCLDGTVLYQPLDELYKMMKAQHNGRAKVLMIVSDFWVDKPDDCKKLIKTIEKDEINVVGLGIDNTTTAQVKTFCEKGRYIGKITELPEAVFDLYREAAL